MKDLLNKNEIMKSFYILIASAIYAVGMNGFIVPLGLYSSGVLGLAQILRTLTERTFDFNFGFDIAGIIQFMLNVPIFIFAYKTVGKLFIAKTIFCVASQSIMLSIVPVNQVIHDPLTSAIIGGILCGFGIGLAFQNGGSSGGVDIIGMYFAKKSNHSVGKISLFVNVFVFAFAFCIMKDIEKIIYTLIFAGISMMALDRMHTQNINCEVMVFTKLNTDEMQKVLMQEMRRGVSYWNGFGAYTGEENRVLFIVVSKYELAQLRRIVSKIDPKAFIRVNNGIDIYGNFEKRL